MLDLRAWMALQNVVERLSFRNRKDKEVLAKTVEATWLKSEPTKLTDIWNRWLMVINLIIKDEDRDRLVESRRGKRFRAPTDEAEDIDTDLVVAAAEGESKADAIATADTELRMGRLSWAVAWRLAQEE